MKKPNYPEPDQVQKLIDEAERLVRLDADRLSINNELHAVTADLRQTLVFSRSENPSRRDPSFMKTFRQKDGVKNVRAQDTKDGRKVLVTLDWSADIRVTNLAGVKRINYLPPVI